MYNIFEQDRTDEIINRILQLRPDSEPLWGKMNVTQMLAHCSSFQDIATGDLTSARSWLGMVIGRFVKPMFYNDKPLPQNMSTIPDIMITDERDFELERESLIQKIITFQHNGRDQWTAPHPFFGKLSTDEWGKGIYKHLDHHLRQFGV
ncbi:DUF1569 domain-containing protein [Paenibacillus camelliae]|uniref:DUF1569 domain-containing protein n=1 Tax=Paenibacillus camelliae TaxID=512410 RepID=UPI002042522E|nr:DUF1569 domain-containing protein [Paenibacillus camelliae]MCM3633591.1 DUF1569 domain-containing protein [Paenibacillus camelliae]